MSTLGAGAACAAYRLGIPFILPDFLVAAAFASCPFLEGGLLSHGLTSAVIRRRRAAVALADKGCVTGMPYLSR